MYMNRVIKWLLMLSVCSVALLLVLARLFATGHLSPRGLGIGLLMYCIGVSCLFIQVVKKSARTEPEASLRIDDMSRRRRLLAVQAGWTAIAILVLLLINGLRQLGNVPTLPLAVGATMNLLTTAVILRIVLRVQKTLR